MPETRGVRQLQITVPRDSTEEVDEVLDRYSSDVSSKEAERKDEDVTEFSVTVESSQIDELTEALKSMEELNSGDLSIRVLEQESLIEKGRETQGGSGDLSQQQIYSKAKEFSGFDTADWGLVMVSAAVASAGIGINNLAVVIGAMMFAPLLSPLVAASTAMTVGDRKLLKHSARTAVFATGLTLMASMAVGVLFSPETELLLLFTESSPLNVALAALVGCAASLASATGRQDQVAGVAVAIALVPPLAASGIRFADFAILPAIRALMVAGVNALGILVAGTGTFWILGLKPETYYKELEARKMWRYLPVAMALLLIVGYVAVVL